MPPKKFEGKLGIQPSNTTESELTSALYRLPESISLSFIETIVDDIASKVNKQLEEKYEEFMTGVYEDVTSKPARSLTSDQIKILHLKLARHFEDNGESSPVDIPVCVDALVESPKFLNSTKGSMNKLFEMHQMKTLQKIAELRRKRSEMTDSGTFNPYENLFETNNGKYYLARLLNMPHLEEESEYMDHCVGTSTSYVNKIKKGEVEILSFRDKATDNPIATIEYDLKSKRLLQVKLFDDEIPDEPAVFTDEILEDEEVTLIETISDSELLVEETKVITHISMPSRKLKIKISNELLMELEKMDVNFKLN